MDFYFNPERLHDAEELPVAREILSPDYEEKQENMADIVDSTMPDVEEAAVRILKMARSISRLICKKHLGDKNFREIVDVHSFNLIFLAMQMEINDIDTAAKSRAEKEGEPIVFGSFVTVDLLGLIGNKIEMMSVGILAGRAFLISSLERIAEAIQKKRNPGGFTPPSAN